MNNLVWADIYVRVQHVYAAPAQSRDDVRRTENPLFIRFFKEIFDSLLRDLKLFKNLLEMIQFSEPISVNNFRERYFCYYLMIQRRSYRENKNSFVI